jgi:hypothetical protein
MLCSKLQNQWSQAVFFSFETMGDMILDSLIYQVKVTVNWETIFIEKTMESVSITFKNNSWVVFVRGWAWRQLKSIYIANYCKIGKQGWRCTEFGYRVASINPILMYFLNKCSNNNFKNNGLRRYKMRKLKYKN